MMSHSLAQKLMALPNQFVFIHPDNPDHANAVSHIVQRLNGIVLLAKISDETKEGGQK